MGWTSGHDCLPLLVRHCIEKKEQVTNEGQAGGEKTFLNTLSIFPPFLLCIKGFSTEHLQAEWYVFLIPCCFRRHAWFIEHVLMLSRSCRVPPHHCGCTKNAKNFQKNFLEFSEPHRLEKFVTISASWCVYKLLRRSPIWLMLSLMLQFYKRSATLQQMECNESGQDVWKSCFCLKRHSLKLKTNVRKQNPTDFTGQRH